MKKNWVFFQTNLNKVKNKTLLSIQPLFILANDLNGLISKIFLPGLEISWKNINLICLKPSRERSTTTAPKRKKIYQEGGKHCKPCRVNLTLWEKKSLKCFQEDESESKNRMMTKPLIMKICLFLLFQSWHQKLLFSFSSKKIDGKKSKLEQPGKLVRPGFKNENYQSDF